MVNVPTQTGQTPDEVSHVHGFVKIDINGKEYEVHLGLHTVHELKKLGGVPLADELEQVIDQRLVPLADDGSVTVHQCAWFVSHPRSCKSS